MKLSGSKRLTLHNHNRAGGRHFHTKGGMGDRIENTQPYLLGGLFFYKNLTFFMIIFVGLLEKFISLMGPFFNKSTPLRGP